MTGVQTILILLGIVGFIMSVVARRKFDRDAEQTRIIVANVYVASAFIVEAIQRSVGV